MPTYRLTAEFIEIIHDHLVAELWSQDEPVLATEYRNQVLIDSAVNRPFQTAMGQEIHPTLVDKGVALFHSLISNHPFQNGNKRTAVLALNIFFSANEHCCFLGQLKTIELATDIAQYRERNKTQEQALSEARIPIVEATVPFEELRSQAEESGDMDVREALLAAQNAHAVMHRDLGRETHPWLVEHSIISPI